MSPELYKCECCHREFDEEENIYTENENKCIFHCEKNDWNSNENKIQYFWEELRYYMQLVDVQEGAKIEFNAKLPSINALILKTYIFKDFIFPKFDISNHTVNTKTKNFFYEEESIFKYNVDFTNATFLGDADFFSVKFDGHVNFYKTNFKKKIDLSRCTFSKELVIENVNLLENQNINFLLSIFNSSVRLENFKMDKLLLEDNKFDSSLLLKNITLNTFQSLNSLYKDRFLCIISRIKNVYLDYSIFENFNLLKLNTNLICIRGTTFNSLPNFTELKSKNETDLKRENIYNRETARIIKNSFEQQNNIIEANKFYALEMKEMEDELKFTKRPFEWLVFKIHGLASNHSQDWVLALLWIINISFIVGVFNQTYFYIYDKAIFIAFFILILLYIGYKFKETMRNVLLSLFLIVFYFLSSVDLDFVSNLINPFSIMTKGEELTFGILIYKIILAYLIYQLIISIRQNTRRK